MRKILRSGETELVDERSVQPHRKLGIWCADLDQILAVNAPGASRERLTQKDVALADKAARHLTHLDQRFV